MSEIIIQFSSILLVVVPTWKKVI